MTDLVRIFGEHPVAVAVSAVSAVVLLALAAIAARRLIRAANRALAGVGAPDLLTVVAAGIATSVAAQGMWQFFGDVLGFSGPLRVLTFAFIEISVMTSAVRARASMRASLSAGVDGIAVWALTGLSAILSSLDARSFGEVVLRLTAPLVAAWLWERGMALERRRRTGRASINWRLSPERILVRLGLADPTDRNASEVDAHRRLMRLALATRRARAATGRRRGWALKRLDRAMEGAVEYGRLGTDPDSRDMLMATLGALVNASDLLDLQPPAPWHQQAPIPDTSGAVSEPSETPAIEAPSDAPAGVNLRHPERGLSEVSAAGQPRVHNLDSVIRTAKADGLSYREIAEAYEVKKCRVEKALKSDSGADTQAVASEVSEVSEIPAPATEEAGPDEPAAHTANGRVYATITPPETS